MWKVETKKETSYLKLLAKTQSIEMITAPLNHQAFPQEHWDHCCQWSRWPNCSSSSLPPILQIQSSFSPSSLYQTTCCNFFCLSFHWITQFFSVNFPLTSCCYSSSPLPPVPGNSPAKPAREESRPSKQEGKFHISFLILSFKSSPQVTFSAT